MKEYKYNHNIIKFTWVCFIDEHGKQHSQVYYINVFRWTLEEFTEKMKEYIKEHILFSVFEEDCKIELVTRTEAEGKEILNIPTFLKALEYPVCGYFNPYIDEFGKRREHPIEDKFNNYYM